jgi:predicted nucleotidyltransferase
VRIYNENLNPKFFDKNKLKPEIRKKLLTIADDFLATIDFKIPKIDDIQLTGSIANYNYTNYSDIDLHILLDFQEVNENLDLVKQAFNGLRFVWNTKHDITLKGHDVEIYVQDVNEPHVSSGLYSVSNNKWVVKPEYNPPSLNDEDIKAKVSAFKDDIDCLYELVDRFADHKSKLLQLHEYGKKLFKKIKKQRDEGLDDIGEFSVGNMVFKFLRNTDYLEKLLNLVNKSYDLHLSESLFNTTKTNHRQQHAVVRDPGTRKHARTVPKYLETDLHLPNCFKVMQRPGGPKFLFINPQDAYKLAKHFGVQNLNRPKGLKKSGVALGMKPSGRFYLMRTKKNKGDYLN